MWHLKECCTALLLIGIIADSSAQDTGQYFEAKDGTSIHYQLRGEGPPVILIHGYMSNIEHTWKETIPILSEEFRVIGIDLRGHGKSEKPIGEASYGKKMANDVVNLMDHLDIEKAHVAGYSLGSMIGLKLAVECPERISSFISGGNGIFESEVIASISIGYTHRLNSFDSMAEALTNGLFNLTDEIKENFISHVTQNDIQVMIDVAKSFNELSVTNQEATAIETPLAVILGENDSSMNTAVKLLELKPSTRIIPIPNRYHLDVFYDEEFTIQIRNFLKDMERVDKKSLAEEN